MNTESEEIKAVYDAGLKVYIRARAGMLFPSGTMKELASSGYGGFIEAGLTGKRIGAGVESGYIFYSGSGNLESFTMIPVMAELQYTFPLLNRFSIIPVVKAGWIYCMMEYNINDPADPLNMITSKSNAFNPALSGGLFLNFFINENVYVSGAAGYTSVFEKSGRMNFTEVAFAAGISF